MGHKRLLLYRVVIILFYSLYKHWCINKADIVIINNIHQLLETYLLVDQKH